MFIIEMSKMLLTHSSVLRLKEKQEEHRSCQTLWETKLEEKMKFEKFRKEIKSCKICTFKNKHNDPFYFKCKSPLITSGRFSILVILLELKSK